MFKLLLIPLYFALNWSIPWPNEELFGFFSYSYFLDLIFCTLLLIKSNYSKINFTNFSLNLKKSALYCIGATLSVLIIKLFNLNAPFKYVSNITIKLIIIAPIIEEFLFRAAFHRILKDFLQGKQLFVCSGLLFSFSHSYGLFTLPKEFHGFFIFQIIYTFFLGYFIAQLFESKKNLVDAIVPHFIFNLIFLISVHLNFI